MRILKLTAAVEKRILFARRRSDSRADRVASRIVVDVRRRGDLALLAWTKRLDAADLSREGIAVRRQELEFARASASPQFLIAVQHAARNVRSVAEKQLPKPWTLEVEPGVRISQIVRPIQSIGCYVPGGRFPLLSTLVMTVVPAHVAGVRRIVVACPNPSAELLATANALGVTDVLRVGGAQAIAALAYGTETIDRVDKIVGPGNRFVNSAKKIVGGDCAIDLPAGPTEAIVLAERGNASWIAADLLAQAEHAPDAGSFLVTTSRELALRVRAALDNQLQRLPGGNPARTSLQQTGAILLAPSLERALRFVSRFAPEHLSLPTDSPALLRKIEAAGTVFLGPWSAQPLGDYASGSNHVLPTGGWAQARGGLSASDFVKCISVQCITRAGFMRLASDVEILARAEGALAHANAIEVRR